MLKAVAIFNRNTKNSRPFKDYYVQWFNTLKNDLLPLLRRSLSHPNSLTILSTHVELLHQHFQSFYHALDLSASNDVAHLLFPDWRNSLEKPLLWLGDLHPYLFTNLVRSFLQDDDDDDDYDGVNDIHQIRSDNRIADLSEFRLRSDLNPSEVTDPFSDKPWQVAMAWRNPSEALISRMDEIERGLREIVPALNARVREAEARFVDRVVDKWYPCRERKEEAKVAVGSTLEAHMEELVSVFLDANRLRRSVIGEIVGETSVYQGALFLEALAQFLIGFRDQDLQVTASTGSNRHHHHRLHHRRRC
ncbi:protein INAPERTURATE POLLEN1 [Senna tora]|uniref:Protein INAPERTURATE POLLEN1 n=1 Tax=Senna tora TaxID=362788 RepID=A0A834SPI0_9FABA|nr:protein INAPERTURATE POLLEN1 [Senna tora]